LPNAGDPVNEILAACCVGDRSAVDEKRTEDPAMPRVEESVVIDAPAEGLFALSQDYALRRAWDPFTGDMRFLGGAGSYGRGVRVWFRARNGLTMVVELVGFRPPRSVAMRMVRGPWFLRRFAGTWVFAPRPGGRAEVTFRYSFEPRWRWLAPVLSPAFAWVFRREVRARLRGLKCGVEQKGLLSRIGARSC
jgi:ribosome-associated toxin RatA of RatAB toxin-antitoxin module